VLALRAHEREDGAEEERHGDRGDDEPLTVSELTLSVRFGKSAVPRMMGKPCILPM
jgi:hypothetical protein